MGKDSRRHSVIHQEGTAENPRMAMVIWIFQVDYLVKMLRTQFIQIEKEGIKLALFALDIILKQYTQVHTHTYGHAHIHPHNTLTCTHTWMYAHNLGPIQ